MESMYEGVLECSKSIANRVEEDRLKKCRGWVVDLFERLEVGDE